jgi:hypothetical protein
MCILGFEPEDKQRNDVQRIALSHPKGRALARRGGVAPRL